MGKYRLKAKDLRQRDVPELKKLLSDAQQELLTLRQKAASGAISSPAQIRELRRNIARILTILNERTKSAPTGAEGQVTK